MSARRIYLAHELDAAWIIFAKLAVAAGEREKEASASAKPQRLTAQEGDDRRKFRAHHYKFERSTNCTELPVLTHLRTAA